MHLVQPPKGLERLNAPSAIAKAYGALECIWRGRQSVWGPGFWRGRHLARLSQMGASAIDKFQYNSMVFLYIFIDIYGHPCVTFVSLWKIKPIIIKVVSLSREHPVILVVAHKRGPLQASSVLPSFGPRLLQHI